MGPQSLHLVDFDYVLYNLDLASARKFPQFIRDRVGHCYQPMRLDHRAFHEGPVVSPADSTACLWVLPPSQVVDCDEGLLCRETEAGWKSGEVHESASSCSQRHGHVITAHSGEYSFRPRGANGDS